jgi:hypothetical protein
VQFGELIYVKIPVGKGCGFVQYASRYVLKWKKVLHCVNCLCVIYHFKKLLFQGIS